MEEHTSVSSDLEENLRSFRTDTLQILIYICQVLLVSWLFLLLSRINRQVSVQLLRELLPWVWFALCTLGAWYEQRSQRYERSRLFFFLALIGGPLWQMLMVPAIRDFMAYALLLSVMLSGVLSGPLAPFRIAAINIGSFLLLGVLSLVGVFSPPMFTSFGNYVVFMLGPSLLILLTAAASWLATRDLVSTVQWAMESNRLAERRAERLSASEARVARTLLELEGAYEIETRLNLQLQQLNKELELARQAADEANTLKTRFLANMSHELRTPLNAIINFTQFMGKPRYGELSPRQIELQERVLVNSEHLLGLINDILDLSKIEAGRMELQLENFDLQPILNGVMATAVGLTKGKGLTLESDVEDELPPVRGDKVRVRQILLNLLSNAAKFTDAGGLTVRAFVGDQMVQVSVSDTGSGIPAHELPLVFEEFHQVEQAASARRQQGTGLGLPISRHLVELQGGTMWAESTVGSGSTFFFTLPIAPTDAEQDAEVVIFDPEAQSVS